MVVCAWQRDDPGLTLRCLAACAEQAARTILVDMSPDPAPIAERARDVEGVEVLHRPDSSGLGESRQYGLSRSSTRYVAFLDSDALPRPGWLRALAAAVAQPDVAVAGGPVIPVWPAGARPSRLLRTQTAGDFLSMLDLGPESRDVPRVLPGNMAVDRELTGVEVFRADRGRRDGQLDGAEEIDMMLRVAAAGYRIAYAPAAAVDHHTRSDRLSARWFFKRLQAAGREATVTRHRLEPMPRRMTRADRAFLALAAVPYGLGRLQGRRRRVSG